METDDVSDVIQPIDLHVHHPPLAPPLLRRRCDARALGFETTADLDDPERPFGQNRAVESARFAMAVDRPGYNLYVLGPSGSGKHALVRSLLGREASARPTPPDYVYVHNFERPDEPRVLTVPAGTAKLLARDMDKLVEDLRMAIPAAFEAPEYVARLEELQKEVAQHHRAVFEDIERIGKERGVAVARGPVGVMFAPLKDNDVMAPEEFDALSDEDKDRIRRTVENLQVELRDRLKRIPQLQKEARGRVRALDREVTRFAVDQTLDELRARYGNEPSIVEYLDHVGDDIAENVGDFRKEDSEPSLGFLHAQRPFRRYAVNVLVDHSGSNGAPVVYEDYASHEHLVGRVEHYAELGSLVTDFTLIKAGALHRANGGFLIVDARKILTQPHAWDTLKRALFSSCVRIEPLPQLLGLSSTQSLRPDPVPLSVKVVLIGSRSIYYQLSQLDPEFLELFKVEADFEDAVARTRDSELDLCRMVAAVVRRENLRPLSSSAMARIVEEASRLANNSDELTTHSRSILDLVSQSEFHATARGSDIVQLEDVVRALDAQVARRDRLRSRMSDAVLRGVLLVAVTGERVGQVNGLAALSLGDYVFGRPTRITATARVGEGRVMDIEREVELGGPLHSKGVLIVSNYVASRYARTYPLSLSASLVFEQSYSGVEGDSASLAELCALLSALAEVPVRQSIALTGSVNQLGQVQAIGAVNEKIEGFFDTCHAMELTGEQGVIVPRSNVQNLMLREDVIAAVAQGEFSIHAVDTVDDAMEILTGLTAGQPDGEGETPPGTLNFLIEQRLIEFAVLARRFGDAIQAASNAPAPSDQKLITLRPGASDPSDSSD